MVSKVEGFDSTVKASNFEPHERFGPCLARYVVSLSFTKNEQNGVSKCKVFLQLSFSSFASRTRLMIPSPIGEKKFSLHEVQS